MDFGAKQDRTAQNLDAGASFMRVTPGGIGRAGVPAGIMRRRGDDADVKAFFVEIDADLAGGPANANHLRGVIDRINENLEGLRGGVGGGQNAALRLDIKFKETPTIDPESPPAGSGPSSLSHQPITSFKRRLSET